MIITCNTNALNKAIQTAQRAIISKPSTPIFSCIHLFTQEGKLSVQAMDLNMAISCTLDADITQEGEIVVSAKHLSELIRKLPSETLTIAKNTENKTIKVTSGKSEFQLLLMNEEDYPKFPDFNGDKTITIADEKIKELIKKTIFSCSNDESRPLFTGILVEAKDNKITFVGTNTHRLAIKSLEQETAEPMSMIIPSKVLLEISRNLTGELPQEVKISLLNNQIMVVIDNVVIVSRLIEGKFPDYNRVIPAKFAVNCKVNAKELAGAVERVALFSTEGDYSIVKLSVTAEELTLTSSSPDVGTGRETIACAATGDKLNVAFNSKYLLDILKNIDADEINMAMNTSLSPVCITCEAEKDYIYIVTPVRVVF
ncbi:DNA polymerase III subunit beta [Phascolarctobacterium sp.]|uniref:DNA polymerase III subunit beta n=1 Tax=Phascolarctobacterium sp. TaxID=2049039 RepID=UPI003864304B